MPVEEMRRSQAKESQLSNRYDANREHGFMDSFSLGFPTGVNGYLAAPLSKRDRGVGVNSV